MSNSAKKLGVTRKINAISQNKKNYSNARFHSAVDLAKFYSGQVDTHFQASKFENHVLSSINRSYKNGQLVRPQSQDALKSRERLSGNKRKQLQKVKLTNKRLAGINPEEKDSGQMIGTKSVVFEEGQDQQKKQFSLVRSALNFRVQKVPEYSSSLRQKCDQKKNLQNYIADLKRMIIQQKKLKTKISLNCNKIMNQRELTYKNTCKKEEQNYHLSVKIAAETQNCVDLDRQNEQINQKIKKTQKNINSQRQLRDKVKKYVEETRIILRGEEKDVAQMKQWQSSAYHNMNNNYLHMNQYKEEKALLLAQIDTNYIRHGSHS